MPRDSFEQLVPPWLRTASLVAALLTIPTVILDMVTDLPRAVELLVRVLNWSVWCVFLLTLVVALAHAPSKWAAIKANPILPIVVVLTTPLVPAGLQMFRLLRLGALLGAAQHARTLFSIEGLRWAAAVVGIVVIGGGAVFAAVEDTAQHLSFTDGVWFAIVTVTTVGYGDIVPHTEAGRAVATVIMITGIGTAALVVGAASQRFLAGQASDEADEDGEPSLGELHRELKALRGELADLRRELRATESGR